MANLTPEQFEKALSNAKQALKANMGKILINATNIGSAEMQIRVFNKGITTAGKQMRYKSKPYMKLRQDAGLEVGWKNLQFTDNLFNSMTILTTAEREVTYGFNNAETAQIAEWQQTSSKQVNEPIFELSQKEINRMEKQMALDAMKIIQGAINGFPNVPTIAPKDATQKSIARNKAKKQKQKAKAKSQKDTARFKKQIANKPKTKDAVQRQKELIAKREASLKKSQERLAKLKTAKKFEESVFDKRRAIADKKQASLFKAQQSLAKKKKAEATAKEKARIARAKQMRLGTYKPKKRKKK
jgi:hypothetical protein